MGWLGELTREWLVNRAERGAGPVGGWVARVAVGLLCWRLRWLERGHRRGWPGWLLLSREDDSFEVLLGVTRVMVEARDARVSRAARRTLEKLTTTPAFAAETLTAYTGNYLTVTSAFVAYLLAPLPEATDCPHGPRVRLVGYLSEVGTADTTDRVRAEWEARLRVELARELVRAVCTTTDDGVGGPLSTLLSTTDQPLLLQAMRDALREFASRGKLWSDARPLTRILPVNPYVRLPVAGAGAGSFSTYEQVLLAVLAGDDDPVPQVDGGRAYQVVSALLDGTGQSGAPEEFGERCRRALHALEPGPVRDALCALAADRNARAEAVVIEAGFASEQDLEALRARRWPARDDRTTSDPWKPGSYPTDPGIGFHT